MYNVRKRLDEIKAKQPKSNFFEVAVRMLKQLGK